MIKGGITVIGPQIALDLHYYGDDVLEQIIAGDEYFPELDRTEQAAGKGLNVATNLSQVGIKSRLITMLNPLDRSTPLFKKAFSENNFSVDIFEIDQPTRVNTLIVDGDGRSLHFSEKGEALTKVKAKEFIEYVKKHLPRSGLILAVGAIRPGIPKDFWAEIIAHAETVNSNVILDTSSSLLLAVLKEKSRPFCIKVNEMEVREISGELNIEKAIKRLRKAGVKHVIVTFGSKGAIYSGAEGDYKITAAEIIQKNSVGPGDAFMAGLAYSLNTNPSFKKALPVASAFGALCAGREGTDIGKNPRFSHLIPKIRLEQISKLNF